MKLKPGFPPKFQKKIQGNKDKNLGKNYQKVLSKIKEIRNISDKTDQENLYFRNFGINQKNQKKSNKCPI